MFVCDWSNFDTDVTELLNQINDGKKSSPCFPVLALTDSLEAQRKAAQIFVNDKHPANFTLGSIPKISRKKKIRIGYFSADFHEHATAYLMAELFESHDKESFEIFAFSFGPDKHDLMRERLTSAFDHFTDVRLKSDSQIAQLSRELGIDLAIDLKGFTQGNRMGIFSFRAAPLQIGYLGYPGTSAAPYIDYLIADHTLIPNRSQDQYTEKIIYLPNTYQVNDRKRQISDRVFTREELGLPPTGFIFCCFNNNFKITPHTFDSWVRILKAVNNSVLWLLEDNPIAAVNLRKAAELRGLDARRLVFAQRLNLSEHLARQRVADLFLDTFPCNAHTTASDALWAGLPVLTRMGKSFASRVAGSLLNAIELPELITETQEQYETNAIEFATNPDKLNIIKNSLLQNIHTCALFDTQLFTRGIESIYKSLYEDLFFE
jgi:predicted O-linked N-acetylglucosamine transferase (SPINDLY family)